MLRLLVPLLNANDDELVVAAIHVSEGDVVRPGELLFSLESTKATSDVEAPAGGHVRALSVEEGQRVPVGALLCVLTDTPDEEVVLEAGLTPTEGEVRATRKARELALRHGVDLSRLGVSGIIKERDVRSALELEERGDPSTEFVREPLEGSNPVIVFGAGGHARVIVDLLREGHRDRSPIAVVDDGAERPADVLGVPVVGGSGVLAVLRERGAADAALGVGAVTHNKTRITLFEKLRALGFALPNLVHPRSSLEPSVSMGMGNQIFAGAIVGSAARLGDNVIVNSGVVVSHDCSIGSHSHLTPGAILAGGVTIGENTVIGMGVTVYLGVTIGRDVVISNGVHVLHDVPDGALVRAQGAG